MPRKYKSTERFLKSDPKFDSKVIQKFINCMMWGGKKATAERIFYNALEIVGSRVKDKEPNEVFLEALNNVKPRIEVKSKRVGGATYQVPVEVPYKRQQALAIRWILAVVRGGKGKPAHVKLANEIVSAYKKEGAAMKKREDIHKMADANKAFAHFNW